MPRSKKNYYVGYDTPFAANLRGLIDEAKIPQTALADFIGVTRQAVSSYSLGTSLPDIEKFEKIADYFEVSTEYLLGRTDIKKADASKQASAEYLGLSEGAIDAIRGLQGVQLEQNVENDYKLTAKPSEPLPEIFSMWLEKANLSELVSNICRTLNSTAVAQDSGWSSDRYKLNQTQKDAVVELKQHGYVTLSMSQQVDFFSQSATKNFSHSVDELIRQINETVNEANRLKNESDEGDEGDEGGAR